MPSKTFTTDELDGYTYRAKFREGRGARRWSETFDVVFEYDEKLYHVLLDEGLTECQDLDTIDQYRECREAPDGGFVVECPEVELYQTMLPVTKFRRIPEVTDE